MIVDHIGIAVSDLEKSKKFYLNILSPLGIEPITEYDGWIGFGKNFKAEFWLGPGKISNYFMHVAFIADTKEIVDAFYTIAIKEGATCSGKPKIRNDYYPGYYGAFILDYDGHTIGAIMNHL
jgi:catechol 2,3-dioxygenase-like lactoylglutathione lyase family enzyme